MDKITCPNCTHEFDVEQALAGKLEAHFKAEADKRIAEQAEKFNAERAKLAQAQAEFEQKKERENELFKERLEKSLAVEKASMEQKIQQQAQNDFALKIKALEDDQAKKNAEIKQLRALEIELLKRENAIKEQAENMKFEMEKQMFAQQQSIEEKARAKEREANLLKEKEYQKQLDDQRKLIDEMKRKAEQGSMQMQGEVQELALEELLATSYPFDTIAEVPKGVRGADCIQTVVNMAQQPCGSIVYESKRTKNFGGDWIEKLKQDQVTCKADLAILVTETMPSDMERFGLKDGVWVCGFHEVKSVSLALREQLIKIQSVKSAEENKGDKMELLYSFLTSNEFVQNIQRIVENHETMVMQLNRERRAMERIWKEREKQIWVVQENISSLFGSIKGIAGNELETAAVLELSAGDDVDDA